MKKLPCKLYLLVCIVMVSAANSYGQVYDSDSLAVNNTIIDFNKSIGHASMLYNGPEYHYSDPAFKGNAFFQDVDAWQPGSVEYDGIIYQGVSMRYDVYKDLVVVLLYNKFTSYTLISSRVSEFDVAGHHFINLNDGNLTDKTGISPGFYDVLYDGKTQILVKRSKNLQTSTGSLSGLETRYLSKTEHFIKKGNNYYSFGSEGSMLSVLKDRKKDIEQYLKTNKVRFKDDPEANMARIAAFYDHLTN